MSGLGDPAGAQRARKQASAVVVGGGDGGGGGSGCGGSVEPRKMTLQ